MGALTSLNFSSNSLTRGALKPNGWPGNPGGWGSKDDHYDTTMDGVIALAGAIKNMGALVSLSLSRNNIQVDGVAPLTAALKMHAIEHQRPCISIRLGHQDQHLLARTKDLRALLVATSNLNPSRCMPAISDDLLKEIAEWL